MKKMSLLAGMLVLLGACHKKYEEKTGDFTGVEVYFEGEYDQSDTVEYVVHQAIYTLSYDRSSKTYLVSNNTIYFPNVDFEARNFKDNHVSSTGIGSTITSYEFELNGNTFNASFSRLEGDVYKSVAFEGTRN